LLIFPAGQSSRLEREAARLAFNVSGTVTPEVATPHGTAPTAQALTLPTISVPNTLKPGAANFGKILTADAEAVEGKLAMPGETDWYKFVGSAGDVMNIETVFPPDRYADPSLLLTITIFGLLTGPMPLTFNSGTFESGDAHLLDLVLPADDTYFISLAARAGSPAPVGDYGLYVYRFEAVVPEPAAATCLLIAAACLPWRKRTSEKRDYSSLQL
jgi:hypothetical protein